MDLQRQTVTDSLWSSLNKLMNFESLNNFRLVGGTSLSLVIGHRISIDIDLFSDSKYGEIDFLGILENLKTEFKHVSHNEWVNNTIGNSCFVGDSSNEMIKLDLFYTDPFVYPILAIENIRISSLEEIVAMKLDVIGRGGRKKDFWDIHALFDYFDLATMLGIYTKRYPYNFSHKELIAQLDNFKNADNDPDPNCLLGKYWELIKIDLEDKIDEFH